MLAIPKLPYLENENSFKDMEDLARNESWSWWCNYMPWKFCYQLFASGRLPWEQEASAPKMFTLFFAYASSILSLFKLNDVPSRNTTHLQLTWLYLYIGFFPVMVFWIQMYIYKRTPFPHFFWMKYWWYEDSLQDLALLWRGALPLRVVNGGWMGPNDAAVIVMLQEALLGPDMVDDLAALQQMWGKDARELRRWVQQYATGSLWDPLSIQVWLGTWIVLVEYQLRDLPQLYAMRMFKKQIM